MTKSSNGSLKSVDNVIENLKVAIGLETDLVVHVATEASARPTCLIVHPKYGLLAIEIGMEGERASDIRTRLNRKAETLRNQLGPTFNLVIQNIVVVSDSAEVFESISQTSFVVSKKSIAGVGWADHLKRCSVSKSELTNVQARLWPSMAFRVDTYAGTSEKNRNTRDQERAILDAEQSKIALGDVSDVMVISGPPGSGKSLVLAARAKHLASLHPDWKILIVVYNRMLAKHFQASESSWPKNIVIVPLKKLLEQRKHKVLAQLTTEFDEPEKALQAAFEEVERLKAKGITADVDALLVDEWQDFSQPYIEYLLECVRPDRGGIVLAGDGGQAIYTDGISNSSLKNRDVKKVKLRRPYRSTRQILDVAQALDAQYVVDGSSEAADGEPVSLIFGPTWQLQAEAIAWEIASLVESGERTLGEIAVLCTTRGGARAVEQNLNGAGIRHIVHTRFWEDIEIARDKVNVMTVHGAKGFGFKVVFVMGFETLRDLDGTKVRDKWGRVGYVAVTRAEDLLYILYKTETQFMTNLKKCKKDTLVARSYPDDYRRKGKK